SISINPCYAQCNTYAAGKCRRDDMKNIFVGNLSFSATEAMVRSLFEKYGPIDQINIVTDRDSGQPKGFGFVEMTNDADAAKAIAALNGYDLEGRTLTVNEARPKTDRPRSDRPGGGGGGGGRKRW
ncbi:MAG TPA: hypothetical protein VGH38_25225, partial [Bryobacteraceae bacterium]